jgi:hypothetical protein
MEALYTKSAAKSEKPNALAALKPTYLRFLCFRKGVALDFDSRLVYSAICDLWFRSKRMPAVRAIRTITGQSAKTVGAALTALREFGLLDGLKPLYLEHTFYEKRAFKLTKWWKGIQNRSLIRNPRHGKRGMREDVVTAFLVYAAGRQKAVSTAYVAAATGIPPRTIRRLAVAMEAANLVCREDGKLVPLAADKAGSTKPVATVNRIKMISMLKGCDTEAWYFDAMVKIGENDFPRFEQKHRVMMAGRTEPNFEHFANLLQIRNSGSEMRASTVGR